MSLLGNEMRDLHGNVDLEEQISITEGATLFRAQRDDRTLVAKMSKFTVENNPKTVRRIYREIDMLSRIDHPSAPTFYGVGQFVEEGNVYPGFFMQFIDGPDLFDYLHEGEDGRRVRIFLPDQEVADIVISVARFLDHLAEGDMVHADIKPENIMISGEGVHVVDYGSSFYRGGSIPGGKEEQFWHRNGYSEQAVLNDDCFFTPEFAAPERYEGVVTPLSDIYSLGCTLYSLLTGRLPFDLRYNTDVERRKKCWEFHVQTQPTDPNYYRREAWGESKLADVCLKMMKKDPDDRYQSGQEVVDAIEEAVHGNRSS